LGGIGRPERSVGTSGLSWGSPERIGAAELELVSRAGCSLRIFNRKGQIMQPTSSAAGGTGDELRSDAQQLGSKATDRIHSEVDARKGQAVDQAKSVSSAIQRAAGELDDGAPTWLKSAFQQGAEQVQRLADAIDQKDSRQLVNEAQNFARERPGVFLAACAAAGFAAARIFRAGGQQQGSGQYGASSDFDRPQPWDDEQMGGQFGDSSERSAIGQSSDFGQQRSQTFGQSQPMSDDPMFETTSSSGGFAASPGGRRDQ
jgi:ElaB/YqjD/DUF883 family membrane-anchored ribosome-binding protein